MAATSPRHAPLSSFSALSFLPILAFLASVTRGQSVNGDDGGDGNNVLGTGSIPPPAAPSVVSTTSSTTTDDSTYYLIVLVVLVVGLAGIVAALCIKRRSRARRRAHARVVTDMEAARGQRALENWRYFNNDIPAPQPRTTNSGPDAAGSGRGIPLLSWGRRHGPPVVEGLNEAGEAPPPYAKQPVAGEHAVASPVDGDDDDAEDRAKVPKYDEAELERTPGLARPPSSFQPNARRPDEDGAVTGRASLPSMPPSFR